MININDLNRINHLFSAIFSYSVFYSYSYSYLEKQIANNFFIASLESGDASFLNNYAYDQIIDSIFNKEITADLINESNSLTNWLGEIYPYLSFRLNKSFSYIFLYLPIAEAIELFDVYHEMDISQLVKYFNSLTEKKTILSLLLKKRNMTAYELSVLTNIKYNTIINYTRNNNQIYEAKYETIYRLSNVLKVPANTFVRNINNYTNSNAYSFDKNNIKYRTYLAYYLSSYFSKDIRHNDYQYINNALINRHDVFMLLSKDIDINAFNLEITCALFSNDIDVDKYQKLLNGKIKKIVLVNELSVIIISKNQIIKKEMTNTLFEAANNLAKEMCGGDFAL